MARSSLFARIIRYAMFVPLIMWALSAGAAQRFSNSVPSKGDLLPGYDLMKFKNNLQHTAAHTIEGVWQYVDDGVILGIEKFSNPDFANKMAYRIVLLQADDVALLPGAVIGYLAQGAKPHHFDIWLYTHYNSDGTPVYPVKCDASLSSDGRNLSFKKNSKFKFRMRVNMSRLLPSLLKAFAISVEPELQSPSLGFVKLFPFHDYDGNQPVNSSLQIRYL